MITSESYAISGRYTLKERISGREQTEVFSAVDRLTGRPCVVKQIAACSPDTLQQVHREIMILRSLKLPGVVNLLDEGWLSDRYALVMEKAAGAPFPGVETPAPWVVVGPALWRLLAILSQIHSRGLVHRDLKPNNVFVDAHQQVTVLDFGIARSLGGVSHSNDAMGSARYASPEQLVGKHADARADLYSVGVMVFEALTGALPHPAPDLGALRVARLTQDAPMLRGRGLPEEAAALIAQMLSPSPAQRPMSAADCLVRLERTRPPRAYRGATERQSAAELAALFRGPERVVAIPQAAGQELFFRTGGWPERVVAELDAWHRAGLISPDGGAYTIGWRSVERLRDGLTGSLARGIPFGRLGALCDVEQELLGWVSVAYPAVSRSVLSEISGVSEEQLGKRLAALATRGLVLESGGLVRDLTGGTGAARLIPERLRQMRARLLAVLPAGAPGRLRHLLSDGSAAEIAEETLAASASQWREGRPAEALAILKHGLPFSGAKRRDVLATLTRIAILSESPHLLRVARYALVDANEPDLLGVVELSLRALQGDPFAVIAQEPPDAPALRYLFSVALIQAARRSAPDVEERVLASLAWMERSSDLRDRLSYRSWQGHLAYRRCHFAEAAALHEQAARRAPGPIRQASRLINYALALLEAGAHDQVVGCLDQIGRCLAQRPHPYYALQVALIHRSMGYRSGIVTEPDVGLIDIAAELELRGLEGMLALNEAAICWRYGQPEQGALLARRADTCMQGAGMSWGALLARSLALECGGGASPKEAAATIKAAEDCPLPLIQLQISALLRWKRVKLKHRRAWFLASQKLDPSHLREVLSLNEANARL